MISSLAKTTELDERIATKNNVFFLLQDEFAIYCYYFCFICGISIFPLRTLGCINRSD